MNGFAPLRQYLPHLLAACLIAPGAYAAQPFGCLIEAERSADVGSQVVGIIDSIRVDRGDQVQKGQILVVLQAQPERAAVALAQVRSSADGELRAAEAASTLANQNLARTESLFQRNFVSRPALDQSRSEAEIARQKIAQARDNKRAINTEAAYAQAQLGQRTIVAPFDGVITDRYMSAGERVEDKPILRIAQINPLRVQVVVPVALYGQIKVGAGAEVLPELPGAVPVNAEVSRVDVVVDPASNTFRAMLRIDNSAHALPAGLRCTVDFAKGTAVPTKADSAPLKEPKAPSTPLAAAAPVKPAVAAAPAKVSEVAPPAKLAAITPPAKVTTAKPPAPPVAEPTAVTAVAHARADVGTHLYAWLTAWRSKDFAAYLASYADDFRPPRDLTRTAWLAERQQYLTRPEAINIRIDNLQIAAVAADELRTTFVQHYQAGNYSDSGRKELLWRRQGGNWLIVQERQL